MISRSMKSRKLPRGSIRVTGTSSALKMVAYSTPMTPAPMTVRLRGTFGVATMSSLSRTLVPLKGMLSGRKGTVPTAIRARSKPMVRSSP